MVARNLDERRRALQRVAERFPVAYDKVLEVHGLRLPKHLAYAVGWWQGLTDEEREETEPLYGRRLLGVARWLAEGRLDDAPLLERERTDSPELLSLFEDATGRWGLWFDDPAELPRATVQVIDGDQIVCEPTLLESLQVDLSNRWGQNDGELPEFEELDSWFGEALELERAACQAEGIPAFVPRDDCFDGIGPWVSEHWEADDELFSARTTKSYPTDAPIVDSLIQAARAQLAADPGRALLVGRELYALGVPARRTTAIELLVAAYRALGRDALAELVLRGEP